MGRILVLFILIAFINMATAQEKPAVPSLLKRAVSGIIKDTTGIAIPDATIILKSSQDSLITRSNADGVFVFKSVKQATFYLTVNSLGYKTSTSHYLMNDELQMLVLEPIIMKTKEHMLDPVQIHGTPSIVYKTDTVEYRASDYKVREHARVDELLKKMEGMEVNRDGSLTHQGQAVTRAKLNGKDYIGGDVATTIQNLPADIVDKIQILDDYGDQAARTGIKDGESKKVLNITTKAGRSIGNTANLNAGAGNNERYNLGLFGTRINANRTVAATGNLNNTINGVANNNAANGAGGNSLPSGVNASGANIPAGSGGSTTVANPAFSYRDTWGKKIDVNVNYAYKYNNTKIINDSEWLQFSILGTARAENYQDNNTKGGNHNLNIEFEYAIDSANFLRVVPAISYSGSNSNAVLSNLQTGIIHQDQNTVSTTESKLPGIGGMVFYQHIFNKRSRNFSLQLSGHNSEQENNAEQNTSILYYDGASDIVLKDSLMHRLIANRNLNNNYRGSFTFSEPLSKKSMLQFNSQVSYRKYENRKQTSNILGSGNTSLIDSLSNIYNYSFIESRFALNYRYAQSRYNLSLGITAIPTILRGENLSFSTSTRRSNFNLIPVFRFQYQWSRQHQLQLNYSGSSVEPTFGQLQPIRDISNPQRPIIGNPDLKASFRNVISLNYNNYIPNSRLNYSLNANSVFINNQVVRNVSLVGDKYSSLKYETRFLNMDGCYSFNGNYSISKQSYNRKYILALNGTISNSRNVSMSNNVKNITSMWRFNERFGPRTEPTEWLEINPYVSFDFIKSNNTLSGATASKTNTIAINIDGKVYLPGGFLFGYSASKNYVEGINANITNNPFVINSYFEKRLFKRRTSTLRLQVFDLLNQNNFINRMISESSIIDTKTNTLSRYVMVSFSQVFQKWSGTPQRNGKPIQRRGDGSFIY